MGIGRPSKSAGERGRARDRHIDRKPDCDISGTCVTPKDAGTVTNCVYCGKELVRRKDGMYYTWDADMHGTGARPQAQES